MYSTVQYVYEYSTVCKKIICVAKFDDFHTVADSLNVWPHMTIFAVADGSYVWQPGRSCAAIILNYIHTHTCVKTTHFANRFSGQKCCRESYTVAERFQLKYLLFIFFSKKVFRLKLLSYIHVFHLNKSNRKSFLSPCTRPWLKLVFIE